MHVMSFYSVMMIGRKVKVFKNIFVLVSLFLIVYLLMTGNRTPNLINYKPMSNNDKSVRIYDKNSDLLYNVSADIMSKEDSNKCISGHILNMHPVCGSDGCLEILPPRPGKSYIKILSETDRQQIENIKGWLHGNIQIDIVGEVTQMQWDHGIFGSVGEIGVYWGKFTSVLASYMRVDWGERLFICDIFDNPKYQHLVLKPTEARRREFEESLNRVGFSLKSEVESRQIRVFDDSSLFLTKQVYRKMGLPAFRLYSVDGSHLESYVINDMKEVSCALRPGGIIILDDASNERHWRVKLAIQSFMKEYGADFIRPFLLIRFKLYLCTSDYWQKYFEYFTKHDLLRKYALKVVNDGAFGSELPYLVEGY